MTATCISHSDVVYLIPDVIMLIAKRLSMGDYSTLDEQDQERICWKIHGLTTVVLRGRGYMINKLFEDQ